MIRVKVELSLDEKKIMIGAFYLLWSTTILLRCKQRVPYLLDTVHTCIMHSEEHIQRMARYLCITKGCKLLWQARYEVDFVNVV